MAIYLEYEGIKGNVTTEGYKDWVRINSLHFGLGRHITMEAGHMANREATKPNIGEVRLIHTMDAASQDFFKESLTGSEGKTAKIDIVRTAADKLEKYVSYELSNVMISSYSVDAGSESAPVEEISLSFAKITMAYTAADKKHTAASSSVAGYDLEVAKPL